MAEALVSIVLGMITSTITNQIQKQYNLVVGVENEVQTLKSNLEAIKAVLTDAERKQMKEETIKIWLAKLKDVSYDIDDVLDEWITAILELQNNEDGHCASKLKMKVRSLILHACFCCRNVCFRHDIAMRIKELNETLDAIAKEKNRYNLSSSIHNGVEIERNITNSFIDMKEVKGRESDKNALINLLLAESIEKRNPHVVSIVGMAGIGKTTLAKLVYNDERVKSKFEYRIWICVSDSDRFDETKIAKSILESLNNVATSSSQLQNIVEQIEKCVLGKKILLVLDDVWNEDRKKWEQLEHVLRSSSLGSKILVTTRNVIVAKAMDSSSKDIIRIGLLSNEESWSIFCNFISSRGSSIERIQEDTGRRIVERCKGLPLAVKSIGNVLRLKDSTQEWKRVLNIEWGELEEMKRDVFEPLWLSYNYLPSSLKQCFLYCAIFPKGHKISRKKLIGMWMSQGYISGTKNKSTEAIGEDYFQILATHFFFIDLEADTQDDSNICCKMHDIVHDLARSLMVHECCSIEVKSNEEPSIFHNLRHAGIELVQIEATFPSFVYNFKALRTLIVLSSSSSDSSVGSALSTIFNELICLRSLGLSGCGIKEVPSNISNLIHLRQLDLSYNGELKELPKTISKLYNLQTLDVDGCVSLKLPEWIKKTQKFKLLV